MGSYETDVTIFPLKSWLLPEICALTAQIGNKEKSANKNGARPLGNSLFIFVIHYVIHLATILRESVRKMTCANPQNPRQMYFVDAASVCRVTSVSEGKRIGAM